MTSRHAMDAQRYDPSKRASRSSSSITISSSAGHSESFQGMTAPGPWTDYALTPYNSPISSSTDLCLSNPESLLNSYTTTPPSSVSTISLHLEGAASPGGREEEIITSMCTFIRPMPRSPIREFFSRPSSPFSRPSSPLSRPTSPVIFSTLNCFSSTDAFEDEIDYLQEQRLKNLEGRSTIQVHVEQETEIHVEELWRDAVQVLLYGSHIQVEGAKVSVGDKLAYTRPL